MGQLSAFHYVQKAIFSGLFITSEKNTLKTTSRYTSVWPGFLFQLGCFVEYVKALY